MPRATDVRPSPPLRRLAELAGARDVLGLRRTMRVREPSSRASVVDLSSNDYLGLSRHPEVVAAGIRGLQQYGAGSTGSRLVSGTTGVHVELEAALAAFLDSDAALVFSSGYAANLGAVTALAGPGTLVVSDAASHASLVDACRLSRARIVVTPTGDVAAVRNALQSRAEPDALVVTDAVRSVDGGVAPVAELHRECRDAGALLLVDEAHAIGVIGAAGRGVAVSEGLAGEPDVVLTMTLSKALGSQGGAVVADGRVREHLVHTARSFIFDTALAPAACGAALAALRLVDEGRVAQLRAVQALLRKGLELPAGPSAITALVMPSAAEAFEAQLTCRAADLEVGCFRPPAVPASACCLRLAARADLSEDDVDYALAILRAVTTRALGCAGAAVSS